MVVRIQFASIAVAGQDRAKPHPLTVLPNGLIPAQDAWTRELGHVIGFVKVAAAQRLHLMWEDVLDNPYQAIGMYPVIADADQDWGTFHLRVESIEIEGN